MYKIIALLYLFSLIFCQNNLQRESQIQEQQDGEGHWYVFGNGEQWNPLQKLTLWQGAGPSWLAQNCARNMTQIHAQITLYGQIQVQNGQQIRTVAHQNECYNPNEEEQEQRSRRRILKEELVENPIFEYDGEILEAYIDIVNNLNENRGNGFANFTFDWNDVELRPKSIILYDHNYDGEYYLEQEVLCAPLMYYNDWQQPCCQNMLKLAYISLLILMIFLL